MSASRLRSIFAACFLVCAHADVLLADAPAARCASLAPSALMVLGVALVGFAVLRGKQQE